MSSSVSSRRIATMYRASSRKRTTEFIAGSAGKIRQDRRPRGEAIALVPGCRGVAHHELFTERPPSACHRAAVGLRIDIRREGIAAELRHERIAVEQRVADLARATGPARSGRATDAGRASGTAGTVVVGPAAAHEWNCQDDDKPSAFQRNLEPAKYAWTLSVSSHTPPPCVAEASCPAGPQAIGCLWLVPDAHQGFERIPEAR